MFTAITRAHIALAERQLFVDFKPFLRRTPILRIPASALGLPGRELWFKLEHLQVSGSFKARGMLYRLLSNELPASGVVIASGGNAGIACAQAARALGVRCEVFVPEVCPQAKQLKLASLGAHVVVGGTHYPQALAACEARQRETGALFVHAYDQPEVVMGAGTLALEIEGQMGGAPDSTLVSVGGGGLIAGLCCGFEQRSEVIALEPEEAPTLFSARAAGHPVDVAVSGVAVDSLGAKRIGQIAWEQTQTWVHQALLLPDPAIRAAQRWMWDEMRLAVEPAAALPLAALQTGLYQPKADETVCLIVCGANMDPSSLAAPASA